MGQFQSNWKKLDPDPPADDEREDYWVKWNADRTVFPASISSFCSR